MSTVLKVVGASWLQTKISSYILAILGVLAILALFAGHIERIQADGNYAATVFYSEKTGYRIEYWGQSNKLSDIPSGVARAYFRRDVDTAGWSLLEVETNCSYPDEVQAYAAGVVEGALTWLLIHRHLENTIRDKCDDTPLEKQCNKLKDHLDKSADIWKKYASDHEDQDPFWHQVSLYYTQMNGIFTGWRFGIERSMEEYEIDISELYWLNAMAEIPELQRKLNLTIDSTMFDHLPDISSAFLKVVNETTEDGVVKKIFLAQNAAGSYSSMTRILKRYKLNYHRTASSSELIPGTSVEFSGYPGSVTSQDEFYIIQGQHRMAVTGTALRNYNANLWKEVNITEQVPVGPRVTAANRLAVNGSSWARALAAANSGTGCKQWLVVDFDRLQHLQLNVSVQRRVRSELVTERTVDQHVRHTVVHRASSSPAKGLVTLVEQVPALTHSVDLSDAVLEQGYWATYGLPFFKDVSESTHIYEMEELHGTLYSETESPRAVLFKRGHKNATSLASVIKLMRQNNITALNRGNDTDCDVNCVINERTLWAVVAVRGDIILNQPFGVIDTKVVSGTQNSSTMEFIAISGPPYTEIQKNKTTPINKGNVAPIYTEQFNNKPDINGLEIRDLVRHQQEEAEQDSLELLNKDVVKPFQWSESVFVNASHVELPDKWNFGPYKPNWSW